MDFMGFLWDSQSDFVILISNKIFQYELWTSFKWFHKLMKP
jgi:hypothetical protein